jgi:hypothetical protein
MDGTQPGDSGRETGAASALAGLREPDPRSLFWIVGGAEVPEVAAAYQQRVMAQFDLPDTVPETVRLSFDRLRMLYQQALLHYDLYTVTGDQARLIAELALRERFVEFYGGTVPFTDGQGKTQTVTATTFDQVYHGIRGPDGRPKRWTIQLRNGRKGFEFAGGMASLLKWARAEGLLAGQGDRMRDGVRKWFRDRVAHPAYHLQGPDHAERAIADVAHIIRQLWGVPSSTSVRRYPVLLAWTDTCVTRSVTGSLAPLPEGANLTCVVVQADPNDPDLFEYDSLFESTHHQCDLLWGPGDPADAMQWLVDHQSESDQVETIDRLFLIQHRGDRLSIPRSPAVAAALVSGERDGTWYLIRADAPAHAFNHQRRMLADESGHPSDGDCKTCPAETVGRDRLDALLRLAHRLGADVTPRHVQAARVTMSRMPRCNRILPSGGWDIPPDDPSVKSLFTADARSTSG